MVKLNILNWSIWEVMVEDFLNIRDLLGTLKCVKKPSLKAFFFYLKLMIYYEQNDDCIY